MLVANPPAEKGAPSTLDPELLRTLGHVVDRAADAYWGSRTTVELVMAALLARGHVLMEDVPGVGKTTLARTVAQLTGLEFQRTQFTSDLLPADVVGVSVYNPGTGEWDIRRGPVFTNILLADEMNRAPPRTQSGLLEAMQEGEVTIDRTTFELPHPFWVIATQNPLEQHGTYPLPESQLDRFLLRIHLGYPTRAAERALMIEPPVMGDVLPHDVMLSAEDVLSLQASVRDVHVDGSVADYMLDLLHATREHEMIALGASPRAGIGFSQVVRAYALVQGRDHVVPDDVHHLLVPVLGHRIHLKGASGGRGATRTVARILGELLEAFPAPY